MVDRYGRVKLTNPDKVLYPATGTTKAEVFDYYIDIAEAMLPHIAGRPATRKRWPNGVDEPSFFEKQSRIGAGLVDRASTTHKIGDDDVSDHRQRRRIGLDRAAGRTRSARAAMAFRGHAGRETEPGPATRIVFDLDPGEGVKMRNSARSPTRCAS